MATAIPKGENSAALADWLETMLLNGETEGLNFVTIGKLLKGEASEVADEELHLDLSIEEMDEANSVDEELDLTMLGTENEIERDVRLNLLEEQVELRASLGEKVYPFRVDGDRIIKVEACGEGVYLLLLALSSSEAAYRSKLKAHTKEANFNAIALAAMKRYLGRDAQGLPFARRSSDPSNRDTRPQLFSDAIEWLRAKLDVRSGNREPIDEDPKKHWEWKQENPLPVLNTYKDGGVDLVVWWKFKDHRRGFPVLLVQCTVQLNWEDKLEEIPLRLWQGWINFSMVPPQTALVIPFSEDPENKQWEDRSLRAGVVIDRVRLLELLNELDCEALTALIDSETHKWAARELATV